MKFSIGHAQKRKLIFELRLYYKCFQDILQLLTTYKIKPDISFFNATIKQYHLLNQHHKVPEIVKLMNNVYHVVPNVATWCAFALGCQTWNEAKTLIHEIETSNFT